MKSKKLIILSFIIFCIGFLGIKDVYADSLGFTCDSSTLNVGDTITCKVIGTSDHPTRGVIAKLDSNSNIEIGAITNISPFTQGSSPIYYYETRAIDAGNYDIVRFNITALAEGTGTLMLRDYGGDDGMGFIDATGDTFYYLEPVNFNLTINSGGDDPTPKSSDSSLTDLVPNIGELSPAFRSDFTAYTMAVDFTRVTAISFTATKSHPMARVGNTTCNLPSSTSVESVMCNIVVTAEDSSKTTYSVLINNSAYQPTPTPTDDIYIEKLTYDVDAVLTPTFKKDVYEYEMSVNFANIQEINFNATVDSGVTVTGKKCTLPGSPNVESTVCTIGITKGDKSATYRITVKNTYDPGDKCDLIIRSNVYTIDQTKKIIKVNSEHSLETIKSNLYSTCGEIKVYDDKVVIIDNLNVVEYKLERYIMPKTGNNKIIYPLAIISVLAIIGIFVFIKKTYFKKEKLN